MKDLNRSIQQLIQDLKFITTHLGSQVLKLDNSLPPLEYEIRIGKELFNALEGEDNSPEMESLNLLSLLRKKVLKSITKDNLTPEIYIKKEEYEKLINILQEMAKKNPRIALFTNNSLSEKGIENFIMYGCSVCLSEDAPSLIELAKPTIESGSLSDPQITE